MRLEAEYRLKSSSGYERWMSMALISDYDKYLGHIRALSPSKLSKVDRSPNPCIGVTRVLSSGSTSMALRLLSVRSNRAICKVSAMHEVLYSPDDYDYAIRMLNDLGKDASRKPGYRFNVVSESPSKEPPYMTLEFPFTPITEADSPV